MVGRVCTKYPCYWISIITVRVSMQRKNDESRVLLAPTSNRSYARNGHLAWPRGSLPFACFSRPRGFPSPPPPVDDRAVDDVYIWYTMYKCYPRSPRPVIWVVGWALACQNRDTNIDHQEEGGTWEGGQLRSSPLIHVTYIRCKGPLPVYFLPFLSPLEIVGRSRGIVRFGRGVARTFVL